MLKGVFTDLRYFLIFFAIVVFTFSLILSILNPEAVLEYPGVSIFAFLIIAFRTSLGDFDVDDYKGYEV